MDENPDLNPWAVQNIQHLVFGLYFLGSMYSQSLDNVLDLNFMEGIPLAIMAYALGYIATKDHKKSLYTVGMGCAGYILGQLTYCATAGLVYPGISAAVF